MKGIKKFAVMGGMLLCSLFSYALTVEDGVCQISSAEELNEFAQQVNSGNATLNAVLTADIDFTAYPETQVSTSSSHFNGTFDGQGHKITLAYDTSADYTGIIRYLGANGTVKNLITDGTITTTERYAGGISGESHGIIQNCASYVTINGSYNGDATNGGLVGRAYTGTLVENCFAATKILAPNSVNCGGVIGWLDEASTIRNCLCITELNLSNNNGSDAICRNNGNLTTASGNNYFLNLYNSFNSNFCTQITEDQLSSGEICYLLNGDQTNIQWTQTLGEDALPVPFSTSKQVNAVGKLNCVGQSADGNPLTFTNGEGSAIPDHNYVEGICSECGKTNPDAFPLVDGFYQLGTPGALAWFAKRVNAGENNINAQLTTDIDYTGYPETQISTSNYNFNGIFDGQGHTIKIAFVTNADYAGLFRYLGSSGVVKNLTTEGTITTTERYAGGISGESHGIIQNCASFITINGSYNGDATNGGLVGRAYTGTQIEFCLSAVKIQAPNSIKCGGIVGWLDQTTTIKNCLCIAELELADYAESDATCRNNGNLTNASGNNYFLNLYNSFNESYCTQITEELLASGEVCYLLNGNQTDIHWYQTIGEDAYPVLDSTHKQVYGVGNLACTGQSADGTPLTYSNTNSTPIPDHQYVNGICVVCGQTDPDACQEVDGYYQIGTAQQMAWYVNTVNNGAKDINAQLTADIDFTDYPEAQIGATGVAFNGTFDGQGHTIKIAFVTSADYAGLFRYLGTSGVVKNLTTEGSITSSARYCGGISGESHGTIQNCASFINIDCSYTDDSTNGGLVGRAYEGTLIEFCLAAAKIQAPNSHRCGGIVGWLDQATTIRNCLCITEMNLIYYEESDAVCRNNGNLTSASGNNYFLNLYNTFNTNYCKQITEEQLASGEVCYLLNGDQSNIHWYQTLGQNEMPTLDPESDIIYKVNNTCGNAAGTEGYTAFQKQVLDNEQEFCENVIAQQSLVEAYATALSALEECNDIQSLVSTYNDNLKPLYEAVVQSEKAYDTYRAKVEETLAYLDEHSELANEKVDELRNYLTESEEPSDLFPNGSAPYIMETGLLSEEEILAETETIEPMLLTAILFSPTPGTNVTKLLTNPDFTDNFNGWEGKAGTSVLGSSDNNLFAGECWNNVMDMYQTLTDLQNGVYELQVNGAFRPAPSDNRYSTSYAGMLYANGIHNFFQADIEDMISAEDAIDGVNCHLTGTNPDLSVTDIDGNVIGYIMYGQIGCCNAFSVGRYPNSVLVNVTDGTLTVGISQPGTNNPNDWLGFGNIQLIYHGTIEEATAGLDNTLACMTARANTLVNVYEPNYGEDYAYYPNFSQALKDQLKETMEAAESATDNETKYKLIETYSDLFQQVYDCKMAYVSLMKQATQLADWMADLSGALTDEEMTELTNLAEYVSSGYIDGTFDIEEASKDHNAALSFMPKEVDGVYEISTAAQLALFGDIVNGGKNSVNAVLTADIDFTSQSDAQIGTSSNKYTGTFDGQGHKITLAFETSADYTGIIRYLGSSGVVKNLITDGTITTTERYAGGISGECRGTIQNCASFVTINGSYSGDATNGGLAGRAYDGTVVEFCLAAVKMQTPNSINCGGIIGWLDETATISNCLCITEMELQNYNESNAICRHHENMTTSSGNNYFLNLYNTFNANYCTQITEDQLVCGEVCYLLNGDQSNIQWYQTIGEDAYPIPFATRGKVGIDENGLYINTAIQQIAANKVMRDGIYNLLGQKLKKTGKGVNIVEGKKVLVK